MMLMRSPERWWILLFVCMSLVTSHTLPTGPLIAGYANACDDGVLHAARRGVNVIYWFASSLLYNSTTKMPYVSYGGPDLDCIANISLILRSEGLKTSHLISVGGWDAPHPDTTASSLTIYDAWKTWQTDVVTRPGLEEGFNGIDWDLEGNDDVTSPYNTFTLDVLNLVGEFSAFAKKDGYIISMVPPESYFDVSESRFNRSLLLTYNDGWQPQFTYHGRNAYAYVYSKWSDVFDIVLLQLYETFSHLDYAAQALSEPPSEYLKTLVPALTGGWWVDFSSDPVLNYSSRHLFVPPEKLLLGFGNAWAQAPPNTPHNETRNTLVLPEEIELAHKSLGLTAPRGYFFWCIAEEGKIPNGKTEPLYFAEGLNKFLKVRNY